MKETQNESTALPKNYSERLAMAKLRETEENAERLRLSNVRSQIDIDRCSANLCYITTAEEQISTALASVASILKTSRQELESSLHLNVSQCEVLADWYQSLMEALAAVDVKLESTEMTDARIAHTSLVEKDMLKRKASAGEKAGNGDKAAKTTKKPSKGSK